ncbi:hypothetical protein ABPG74_019606 [Tetrahymena malaccensis]
MDYEQFTQKFEEMEAQMGPLSAFTNYQLQNAISWGFIWSLAYIPIQITNFIDIYIDNQSDKAIYKWIAYIFIYLVLLIGAYLIFHYELKKLNHQFLEKNSILEVLILYLFPFCPLYVLFYVTIFEMILRTCKYYVNIVFHWFTSIMMMITFCIMLCHINQNLFFINVISIDIFSILVAYENGKIINPMNNKQFILMALGIYLLFYGLFWLFNIGIMKQLYSFLLYLLQVVFIHFQLQKQIYPLYGNTPIHIFLLNKVVPFTLNILISLNAFK